MQKWRSPISNHAYDTERDLLVHLKNQTLDTLLLHGDALAALGYTEEVVRGWPLQVRGREG